MAVNLDKPQRWKTDITHSVAMYNIEAARLALQIALDGQKSQEERNRLGQFATPPNLARAILAYALSLLREDAPVRFFDPAIGTGSFYSALLATAPHRHI